MNPMLSKYRTKKRVTLSHPLSAFVANGEAFSRPTNLARAWEWMVQGAGIIHQEIGDSVLWAPWVDLADTDPSNLDGLDRPGTAGHELLWMLLRSSIVLSDVLLVVNGPSGYLLSNQMLELEMAIEANLTIVERDWGDLP